MVRATMRPAISLWCILVMLCGSGAVTRSARGAEGDAAKRFESQVAPLLTRHCSECHGASSKKGRLDLSRKELVLAGGERGAALVPGKAEESLLWELVESDEMPENRPPLSAGEKKLLRQWIDDGAVWPEGVTVGGTPDEEVIAANWLRRLTVPEYIETVRQAVVVDIEREARTLLPRDLRADGFSNTAYNLSVDLEHVEAYAKLAELIVAKMDVAAFAAKHAPCRELSNDCMPEAVAAIGKWLLRGPLEEHELAAFLSVSTAVADEGGDFHEAVAYVVETMLQSPRFLYRIEKQRGDAGEQRIGDYELASRISYILWGGPPDEELMRAADAGELSDREKVEQQVQRMLQDPRTIDRSSQFIAEWLNLEQLDYLRPNSERFPRWNAALAADMREETLAYFREVVWTQNRPLWDLMNAQVTFATPRLAEHYGLDASSGEAVPQSPEPSREQPPEQSRPRSPERVSDGLQALYRFDEGSGQVVRDHAGAGEPLDLHIDDAGKVAWGDNGLTVKQSTRIASDGAARRLASAVQGSNAITLEAWITPTNDSQAGPARIVTLSSGPSERNFTLGQDGNKFDARLRATQTDRNGMPSLSSPSGTAAARPTHVVYTRDSGAQARVFIDGVEVAKMYVQGDLSNWDASFSLTVANEASGDRPWLGTLHRVAIYSRALTPQEVLANSRINTPLRRYELAAVPARGGLLTQGSVLTIGGDDASMVSRGLFVLKDILYDKVGDPPPCLDTTPVPTRPGLSTRAVAISRVQSVSCGGCHSRFEPLAFGLERFDGLGSYQEKDEHGNQLRDDGEVHFPDQDEPVAYRSSAELMDLLAASDRVRMNFTRKVTQFALGRPLVESDAPILDQIHQSAQQNGGTYPSLITAIVMSDLVQMTSLEMKQ